MKAWHWEWWYRSCLSGPLLAVLQHVRFWNLQEESIVLYLFRTAHFINNIICMISSFIIMQINFPETILIGRFVYGWCIACYCSWSPLVIREIAPVNLRPLMGSVFSIGRVGAIMLGYLLGLIFYLAGVPEYYRIMFCLPGIMALIQLILMIPFVPDSPTELF